MEDRKIFNTIEEAIEDIRNGKMVIVADDEARENEGDIICAADRITPKMINFMATECRGLICLAMNAQKAKDLNLTPMVERNKNTEGMQTAFSQSIDGAAKYGVSTGISVFDRAKTIQIAVDKNSKPEDLRRPGHVFPCIAKQGGVLERAGHTEASIDLARLAGFSPNGVMCEIMNEDGTMARRDELKAFALKHDLKFVTVQELIAYRLKNEKFVIREAEADLPTEFGEFKIYGYRNVLNNHEYVALVKDINKSEIPLVRVHSECLTGDVFHSLKCDCNSQLHSALEMINKHGNGALVYMTDHEGRGIGIVNKIKAYRLQQEGQDTVEANLSLGFQSDLRDYGVGAQILLDLGYNTFNLITNNPKKIIALKGYGLVINDIIKVEPYINSYNKRYMDTKREKMHHFI